MLPMSMSNFSPEVYDKIIRSERFDLTEHWANNFILMRCPGYAAWDFSPPDGGQERKALKFGSQKINLHDAKAPYVPHAKNSIQRAIDLCFITDTPIQDWIERVELYKIPIESGPVEKTEATGPIMSVYIRDPDENLIEISNKI